VPAGTILVGRRLASTETIRLLRFRFPPKQDLSRRRFWSCLHRRQCTLNDVDLTKDRIIQLGQYQCRQDLCRQFVGMAEAVAGAVDPRSGWTVSVLRARLTIDSRIEKLAPWERKGFFKRLASYDGFVRINVTEGGAARMSIRLDGPDTMEVVKECQTESQRPGFRQVDLLVAEGLKQFGFSTPKALSKTLRFVKSASLLGFLTNASTLLRGAFGYRRAGLALSNATGIAGKEFYTGLPFQLGRGACKMALLPRQVDQLPTDKIPCGEIGSMARMQGSEEEVAAKYAEAVVDIFEGRSDAGPTSAIVWDFALQIAKTCPTHDLLEADVCWDESVSPYQAVGTLTVFPEPALAGGIAGQEGSGLFFNPWNALAAHRPLGAMNHARLSVYQKHSEVRRRSGGGKQLDRVCPFLSQLQAQTPLSSPSLA